MLHGPLCPFPSFACFAAEGREGSSRRQRRILEQHGLPSYFLKCCLRQPPSPLPIRLQEVQQQAQKRRHDEEQELASKRARQQVAGSI